MRIRSFGLPTIAAALLVAPLLSGCPGSGGSSDRVKELRKATEQEGDFMAEEFWIYTSLSDDVIAVLKPYLLREFPNLEIKWLSGNEGEVRTRLDAEMEANQVRADLVVLSDPFLIHKLKTELKLMSYRSLHAKDIPELMRDFEGYYAVAGVPFLVVVYDPSAVGLEKAPKAFVDLASPDWAGKVALPDPDRSNAGFAMAATLERRYGWDYFRQLHANGMRLEPSDASVIEAIAAKRASVGATTLEAALAAKKAGKSVEFLYPEDGVIMAPETIAIPSGVRKPELAKAVYDFFLSKTAQDAIVSGYSHSPQPEIGQPLGAKPWSEMFAASMTWNPRFVADVAEHRAQIGTTFRQIMAN